MAFEAIVHGLLAAFFLFTVYYDGWVVKFPDVFRERNEQSWGRSKYLSYWNLYFQTLFFSLSFLNDILRLAGPSQPGPNKEPGPGKCGGPTSLDSLLDVAFASIGFPVSLMVSTSFGLIFAINRELAYPLMLDTFIPRWLTYNIQFLVLPAVVVEMLLVKHRYESHRRRNQLLLCLYIALNLGWVLLVGHACQYFAYPSLEPLTVGQQLGVVVLSAAFGLVPYYLGEILHGAVWGTAEKVKLDQKKRR